MAQELHLNCQDKPITKIVHAVQNDTGRVLKIYIEDRSITHAMTFVFIAEKPSGLKIYNSATYVSGHVEVELTNQALAEVGNVKAQLQITDTNGLMTSYMFYIAVDEVYRDDSSIESSNEFTALQSMSNDFANMKGQFEQAIAAVTVDSEVITARTGADGTQYPTLASRLNTENTQVNADLIEISYNFANSDYHRKGDIIVTDFVKNSFYSTTDGTINESTSFKRSRGLIPVNEFALYTHNKNYAIFMCCFDANKHFIKNVVAFKENTIERVPNILPAGTAYIGITSANNDDDVILHSWEFTDNHIEYPYNNVLYIDNFWMKDTGVFSGSNAFATIVIPNPDTSKKMFCSTNIAANFVQFDGNNNFISNGTNYEQYSPKGRIYTLDSNCKLLFINIYKTEVNSDGNPCEFISYLDETKPKVLTIGDSISWLNLMSGYGNESYMIGWQCELIKHGYQITNYSFSGYPYANGNNGNYIYKKIVEESYDVSEYDIIILFGGTNDVLYNIDKGSAPTDYRNIDTSKTTMSSALSGIISYIRNNNHKAKVFVATYPKSEAYGRTYTKATQYKAEILSTADFFSCHVIDVWNEMNVTPLINFENFFYDDTHPNYKGMKRIGEIMLKSIQ